MVITFVIKNVTFILSSLLYNRDYEYSGRFNVGQNIATSPYKMTWDAVVQLFYNESKDFTYGGNNDLEKVGHFTQVRISCTRILFVMIANE